MLQGTSSILRFLQSSSTSSSKQDNLTPLQETNSLSIGICNQHTSFLILYISFFSIYVIVDILIEGTQEPLNIESQSLSQNVQTTNAWSYKLDEIDQSVIEELPLEIQQEFRTWLRPQKRPNIVKRGSSIAHYFSPTKN